MAPAESPKIEEGTMDGRSSSSASRGIEEAVGVAQTLGERPAKTGLWSESALRVLGERYLPEAVVVETRDGKWMPAMTYICPSMAPRPAERAYVDRIVEPARQLGFPEWYVARLESFRP